VDGVPPCGDCASAVAAKSSATATLERAAERREGSIGGHRGKSKRYTFIRHLVLPDGCRAHWPGGETGGRGVATYTSAMPVPARASRAPVSDAADEAYRQLRALIVRGELAPAARLTEPMVVARLGVSRTPAREAMHRLEMQGLLVHDGGGARPRMAVAPLDTDEARDVYQATGLLEAAAARMVADWAMPTRAKLAASLRKLDDAFRTEARAAEPDAGQLYARHHNFHDQLRVASASAVTRELLRTLEPRLERYEWFHGPLLRLAGLPFAPTYAEHTAIIAAVRTGTSREIEHAVRTNWWNAAERLVIAIRKARAVVGARSG
jgi:DNA-binding GntR family transcriptional regulator